MKYFLPKTAMYHLYCTLILPYLKYLILLWESAYKKHVDKILKIQNRAIRIISNSSYLCHTKPLFEKYEKPLISSTGIRTRRTNNVSFYINIIMVCFPVFFNSIQLVFDSLLTNLSSSHGYDITNVTTILKNTK